MSRFLEPILSLPTALFGFELTRCATEARLFVGESAKVPLRLYLSVAAQYHHLGLFVLEVCVI